VTVETEVAVTVRYFAAARAAAGVDSAFVAVPTGSTIADLIKRLGADNAELERVLRRCSFLCDEIAVRDLSSEIYRDQTVDVLPPFAGG
jgi:molybdopterin converting factor small subunit